MGALTNSSSIQHKRECPFQFQHPKNPYYAISNSIDPDCVQNSKKPKLSSSQMPLHQQSSVPNSSVAMISRYPETSTRSQRPNNVHAPCRVGQRFPLPKLRTSAISQRDCDGSFASGDEMEILLSKKCDRARRAAFDTFRFVPKKEVIDLEAETARDGRRQKEVVSDDSGVEEVVGVSDGSNDGDEVKILEERSSVVTSDGDGNVMGVKNVGKMVESLGLKKAVNVSDKEEAYKKLMEESEKRRGNKLKQLGFEIELNERKRSAFKLLRSLQKPVETPVEEVPPEAFMPLTKEEDAAVKRAFAPNNRRKILVSHKDSSIDISGELLRCLAPSAWLNDEVINLYLALLKEREKREPHKFIKCHFFNTFFYKKLASGGNGAYDYKSVRRWTTERKLGYALIDCEKIFIPVHREIHWCLAIINRKDQKFQYLDSLKGRDVRVLEYLAKYYVDEVKDKSGRKIDVSNWEREFVEDLPEQQNGYDCGVFMIKYADFYSRGLQLCFSQEDMPYFRVRTAKEILELRAN